MAAHLGISIDSARGHMQRAKQKIRDEIARQVGQDDVDALLAALTAKQAPGVHDRTAGRALERGVATSTYIAPSRVEELEMKLFGCSFEEAA